MRKFIKICLIGLGLLMIILALVVAWLRVMYPAEKLRPVIEEQIRRQTHREARLGDVGYGLQGIWVKRFQLSNVPAFSAGTFLEIDRAQMTWNLWSLFRKSSKTVRFHMDQAVVHSGSGTSDLPTTLSNVDLVLKDFGRTWVKGDLAIDKIENPVYRGKDFSTEWSLTQVDSTLTHLNGWMRLRQGPGMAHNLHRLAATSRSAKLVLMPLLTLQSLDQLGLVRLGLPNFSRMEIHRIIGDYGFKDGLMTIHQFKIEGPELTIVATGTIQLATEKLAIEVKMNTVKPVLMGETSMKVQIGGTISNPRTNLDSLKQKAFKATIKNVINNPDTLKNLKNIFK